jgi:hypothetical protein
VPVGLLEAVSDAAWGDVSQIDYDLAQWRRASLIGPSEPSDVKGDYKLQVRLPNGDLSRGGCHAAAARINQVDAPAPTVKAAAKKLAGLYRNQLDEDPPWSLLALAGMAQESRRLHESTPLDEAARGQDPTGRRMRIKVISPGWGTSGYYPAPVLEQVGKDKLIGPGTHMFLDHPTVTEDTERPERSVRDLAAVTITNATWDPQERALMAEAMVFAPFRGLLAEQAPHIGVSIRASGVAEQGEAEGRQGTIITAITEVHSVDFVTAAGRGGQIVALLESARGRRLEEARNVGAWIEAGMHTSFTQVTDRMYAEGQLTRPERICLSTAVGDALGAFVKRVEADAPHLYSRDIWDVPGGQAAAVTEALPGGMTAETLKQALADLVGATYGGKDIWTYVQDLTDREVIFRVEDPDGDGTGLWRQTYKVTSGTTALTGTRVEVRADTTYVPVTATESTPTVAAPTAPGGSAPPKSVTPTATQHTEGEGRMAEIPDTELASLQEAASKKVTLESRVADLAKDLEEARGQVKALGTNATRMVEAERGRDAAAAENRRLHAALSADPVIRMALGESTIPSPLWPRVTAIVTGPEGRAIPLTESGSLDVDALHKSIAAAIDAERTVLAQLAETAGAGIPRGMGAAPDDDTDTTAALEELFVESGLSKSAAQLAARGRG